MVIEEHPADISRFEAGHVLAGYRLETKIGEGGMAAVYRARDERLRRTVALKILAPEFAADAAFRRRFIGESEAAAAVDHPHIIPVYDQGEVDGILFISMRYVAGGDLRRLMLREGMMSPTRVADVISPVASALDAAHRVGLVHRDVKPGNILVDTGPGRPDHVMLSDFGVSKSVTTSANLTGTGQFIGTAGYSAPEQIQEFGIDGRADQYALACVTYEMLTGSPLFHRITIYEMLIAHVNEQPPALTSRRPDLPFAADQVMAKTLAKTPTERYATCTDFADALRDAFGLPPYHAGGALSGPAQGQAPPEPPTIAVPRPAATEWPAGALPLEGEPESELLAATEKTTLDQHTPTVDHDPAVAYDVPSAAPAGTTEALEALAPEATAESLKVKEPEEPEEGAEPAADEATSDAPETASAEPLADMSASPVAALPPTLVPASHEEESVASVSEPELEPRPELEPGEVSQAADLAAERVLVVPPTDERKVMSAPTGWRRRLPLVAVAAVVIGAGVALPFMLTSPAVPPPPKSTPTPTSPATTSPPSPSQPPPLSPSQLALPDTFRGHAVSSVAFSASGTTLAIAGTLGTCLWDFAAKECTVTEQGVWSVAFSHSGRTLAGSDDMSGSIAGVNGDIRLWNAATGAQIGSAFTDPDSSGALSDAFSPNDATLAVGDRYGSTYLWNVATRTSTALTDPKSAGVNAVAFSPNGVWLAVADANGNAYLWNVATHQRIATFHASGSVTGALAVAFSPDGKTLAVGDGNGHTYLWNVTAKPKLTFQLTDANSTGVRALAFSPNGQMLATGDNNGTACLWSIPSGKLITALPETLGDGVTSVAFSGDGGTLVTGNEDGTVDTWPVSKVLSGLSVVIVTRRAKADARVGL